MMAKSNSNSSELSSDEGQTWISWYCAIRENNFFCEVEEEFIQDSFNLCGLSSMVPYYDNALDLILDVDTQLDALTDEQHEFAESAAEVLYGLIHARFILTARGMQKIFEKYQNVDFGRCPRVYCQGQPLLPVGLSDLPRLFNVNVYCPSCRDIFHPKRNANLDGAYFGTTFPHLFLLANPELVASTKTQQVYVPRIFGFRISKESAYYCKAPSSSVQKVRRSPPPVDDVVVDDDHAEKSEQSDSFHV